MRHPRSAERAASKVPWHICGTQECEMLSSRVSQRQPTTHETVDHEPFQRGSVALLIRRSSVRARRGRGPLRVCAGQRLRICFRALPNRPGEGPCGTFYATWYGDGQPVHFESVGRRFEPDGAHPAFVLVRGLGSAFMPSRTVPEKGQMAHFWHIVIFNPQVVGSTPVAPSGVCAGHPCRSGAVSRPW